MSARILASDPLPNVRVVLSHTSHPGNIGAAARAMKTMGLTDLRLVAPRYFPDPRAHAMASGALDVLQQAKVCDTLDEALQDAVLAVGLSARHRDLAPRLMAPREAAAELVAEACRHPVALVFGTEKNGLSIDEVNRCQRLVHIPANPEYPSLNLASAVQVMAYELRTAAPEPAALEEQQFEAATLEEIERFYAHLEQTLVAIGFLDPQRPKRLMQRMRRLFSRTRLEKEEVHILRGILSAADPRNGRSNS